MEEDSMKKRTLGLILALVMVGSTMVACGEAKTSVTQEASVEEAEEEVEAADVEETDAKEVNAEVAEATEEATVEEATEEVVEEASAEETEEVSEDTEAVEESLGKEIEIDGVTYTEYDFNEDDTSIWIKLNDGRVVMLLTESEAAGKDLYVSDDKGSLSFDVAISGNKKIVGQTVTVDIVDRVGQIGFSEPADFSELFKKTEGYTVSFGKGYDDGEGNLLVEVFITAPKKMFTTTAVISLD